ncbi:hypothetical protein FOXG_16572 [Fusarium oxysporum f. sp. lycopersici 4287]|uniref:Uncharacterized protein n=3 Tax=Fusarium oxysporum TaxID=5507 RepID=A0A0J9W8L8_FUSO4|nr:hypothetical protein FOXG_16572 [Fusarium oxysporum f. sp. lycopersici 4287]EXK30667.1 hypothetical protein FOMG_13451 [Fusarium oxysporum f. sp. melonis 26406]KAJ9415979.1 hypothetical protein QL093DRAFT_2104453 [Fusarium oxysporum]KNB19148.1 hypothetical protein FOXG_16572 [Fusarium oxysporum f. sp. lycopersici 4287]
MSPQNTDPLAGLDSIDWSRLNHAYGPADDVPLILRELQSRDPEVYKTALDACWSNIYHQGTRYSASVAAIPFLYALLDSPATEDRETLLYLIVSLAIGHPNWVFPNGIEIQEWERRLAVMDPEDRGHAMQELKAYEAVERGLCSILRCLNEDSASMRANAGHALAFFPRQSGPSRVALHDLLSRETNDNVRGTIVLALAILFVRADDVLEKRNVIKKIQEYYTASSIREAPDDIFTESCAVALLMLDSEEDGLAETLQRVRVDEAYMSKLESTIDPNSWFPFAILDLRDLAKSVLENHRKEAASS